MKNTAKTKQLANAIVTDGIGTDIMQGTVVGVAAMTAGLVGAWSVSCLVSGIIAAGGPLGLVTSWFQAMSGM
ncbi:MAG: hypothetical protein OEY01_01230 [Desulfobulbaceae bacterium]|nr:hypothetical protein [Desulfobulbaceae bacterium]HIJ77914.1 hypothetical protein [Deltaproteobacteria bacterium]